jgi:hypothetical protein
MKTIAESRDLPPGAIEVDGKVYIDADKYDRWQKEEFPKLMQREEAQLMRLNPRFEDGKPLDDIQAIEPIEEPTEDELRVCKKFGMAVVRPRGSDYVDVVDLSADLDRLIFRPADYWLCSDSGRKTIGAVVDWVSDPNYSDDVYLKVVRTRDGKIVFRNDIVFEADQEADALAYAKAVWGRGK